MTEIAVVCTTFYQTIDEWRFQLALEMIAEAKKYNVKFYAIDASTNPAVSNAMSEAGAIVVPENTENKGKGKGFAYRFGIQHVLNQHNNQSSNQSTHLILCIVEPEKVDFVRFLPQLASHIIQSNDAKILLPKRSKLSWNSLPFEQYHSEMLGNRHLYNVATNVTPRFTNDEIDWLFGPVVFDHTIAKYYLDYEGSAWDAQIVPYINAWADQATNIQSVEIDYIHPFQQRQHEEFTLEYSSKRLHQLSLIMPIVQKAIEAAAKKRQNTLIK